MKELYMWAFDSQISRAKEFGEACYELRKEVYARRGQHNPKQIVKQIGVSKLGEFMIYNRLVHDLPDYVEISKPSLELYTKPSFDADLTLKIDDRTMNVNIKSQESSSVAKFGYSWVFQKEDKIFKEKKDELLIVAWNHTFSGGIVGIGFVEQFEPFLAPMVLSNMQTNKLAIYLDPDAEVFDPTRKPLVDLILE